MALKNVINVGKVPAKAYLSFIKAVGKFNMPWYLDRYVKYLRKHGMDIEGMPQYIATSVQFDGKDFSKIHIGDKSVLSSDVRVLTHDYSIARALEAIGEDMTLEAYFVRDVTIGRNCFIGNRAILMPGASIGDNSIVGAGSVVRGKVEPNSIVIGNPHIIVGDTLEWAKKKKAQGQFKMNTTRTH